jgi:hypothetical protein
MHGVGGSSGEIAHDELLSGKGFGGQLGKRFMPPYLYRHQISRQPDIPGKKLHFGFDPSNLTWLACVYSRVFLPYRTVISLNREMCYLGVS